MERTRRIATEVIAKSDRDHPADAVLRTQLRTATALTREDSRIISREVFAYFRWLGWLNKRDTVPEQLAHALHLNDLFEKNSRNIPESDMPRAVPEWVRQHVTISTDWLRKIQTEPNLWLRAKSGQGSVVAESLRDCYAGGKEALADSLRYFGATDLFRTREFQAGEFELQDISSQIVGLLCNPQPGETWWDACAGEGGKLLHLCDLMRNKGLVWASDRVEWRLKKLKQRAARARAFNYRSALWDGGSKRPMKTKFDGILVDGPCSGIGTWQRNPQARWTVTENDVRELGEVQERLLTNVIPALKPGGRLIYSVCTLSVAETSEVAERINRKFPSLKSLKLENPLKPKDPATEHLWLWPQAVNGNGMFICAWQNGTV